jgi:hypothetical protein
MKSPSLEYRHDDLKNLKADIHDLLKEIWSTERFAVAATGGVWAFLFGKQVDSAATKSTSPVRRPGLSPTYAEVFPYSVY